MRALTFAIALWLAAHGSVNAASEATVGRASWYAYVPGQAAAGPALRKMLGKVVAWQARPRLRD